MIGWALASITAIISHGGSSDWNTVERLRVTGIERVSGGVERQFTVTRGANAVLIHSVAGVDGQLGGILRSELINSTGVYTWLSAVPRFALQLPYASAPGLAGIASPIRFAKGDLASRRREIENRYGIKISQSPDEELNQRPCMVLRITDKGSMIRQFWVDKETGVALRELDRVGNDIVYDRLFTSFDPSAPLSAKSFELPATTTVIKGAVAPDILLRAPQMRTAADYAADLDGLRLGGSERGRVWLRKLALPAGFDYVGSSIRENTWNPDSQVPDPAPVYRGSGQNPLLNSEWIVPGSVVFLPGGSMYVDTRPVGLTPAEADQIRLSNGQPAFQPLYIRPLGDGTMQATALSTQKPAVEKPVPTVQPPDENTHTIVSSEFLDRLTGDTITFLQLRNLPVEQALSSWSLKSEKLDQTGLGKQVKAFVASKPINLHAVTWQSSGSSFALLSSRLSSAELANLSKGL